MDSCPAADLGKIGQSPEWNDSDEQKQNRQFLKRNDSWHTDGDD